MYRGKKRERERESENNKKKDDESNLSSYLSRLRLGQEEEETKSS